MHPIRNRSALEGYQHRSMKVSLAINISWVRQYIDKNMRFKINTYSTQRAVQKLKKPAVNQANKQTNEQTNKQANKAKR